MRDKIGLFMLEDEEGKVSIQLYADIERLKEAFSNLVRLESNQSARATIVCLEFRDGVTVETAESKNLPVEQVPANERPDGIVLGEGPLFLPREGESDGDKENPDTGTQSA